MLPFDSSAASTGRVVAYARVSTDKQDAANQAFEIRQFMEHRGLVADEFISEVITGKGDIKDRKISGVLESLRDGDTLIVSEVSRISRKLTGVLMAIEEATKRGVTIMTVKGGHVFGDNLNSKIIAFAFGLAAEIERDLISSRTKESLQRKKAEGVKLGRPAGPSAPSSFKLFGKDDEIVSMMLAKIPKAAMARKYGVNRETVTKYIERNNLEQKAREERWKQTGV